MVSISRKGIFAFLLGDEDQLYRPRCRYEVVGGLVRVFVSRDESHVPDWQANESLQVPVASYPYGVLGYVLPYREIHERHERGMCVCGRR